MTDPRALYHATIVDHDRHPRHEGALPTATHAATADNPLCGDIVTIRFVLADGVIADAAFEARGCALSRAAASMLTTRAIGMTPAALHELASTFDQFVQGDAAGAGLGELAVFEGVRAFKSRRGCARLPFHAALDALRS
ncbi:MAG TPA: SUF system NifU family Fe-S cluster assembly protein [Kofleriaceae bacterium]|nr:SUF system NifU family Fe-S cluster assembly protein [Kofleriaceae bacterium]